MVILPYIKNREKLGNMDYMQRLRAMREDMDKTQQEVADYLGIAQNVYSRYERGTNELPIRHLVKLCQYFSVSADYVLELPPEYKRNSKNETGDE